MGITLPRKYGGLNFPVSVSVMSSRWSAAPTRR